MNTGSSSLTSMDTSTPSKPSVYTTYKEDDDNDRKDENNGNYPANMYILPQNTFPDCLNDPIDGYWRCENSTLVSNINGKTEQLVVPYDVDYNKGLPLYNTDTGLNLRNLNLATLGKNYTDYHKTMVEYPYGNTNNLNNENNGQLQEQKCGIVGYFNYPLQLKISNIPAYINSINLNNNNEHPQLNKLINPQLNQLNKKKRKHLGSFTDLETMSHFDNKNNWRYTLWCGDNDDKKKKADDKTKKGNDIIQINIDKKINIKGDNGLPQPLNFQFLIIANKPEHDFDKYTLNRNRFTIQPLESPLELSSHIKEHTDVLIIKSTVKVETAVPKTERDNIEERTDGGGVPSHSRNLLNNSFIQEYNMIFKKDISNAKHHITTAATRAPAASPKTLATYKDINRYILLCSDNTESKIKIADDLQKPIDVRKRGKEFDTELRKLLQEDPNMTMGAFDEYLAGSGIYDQTETTPSLGSFVYSSINRERKRLHKRIKKTAKAKGISQILTKRRRQHRIRKQIKKKTKRHRKPRKTKRHRKPRKE